MNEKFSVVLDGLNAHHPRLTVSDECMAFERVEELYRSMLESECAAGSLDQHLERVAAYGRSAFLRDKARSLDELVGSDSVDDALAIVVPGAFSFLLAESSHPLCSDIAQLRNTVVMNNFPVVIKITRRYFHPAHPVFLDALSEGFLGLYESFDAFNVLLKKQFLNYAYNPVRRRIHEFKAHDQWWVMKPYEARFKVAIDNLVRRFTSENGNEPSDESISQRLLMSVDKVSVLRRVTPSYISLDDSHDGRPFSETLTRDPFVSGDVSCALMRRYAIGELLSGLSRTHQRVIFSYFGLWDGVPLSYEQVGRDPRVFSRPVTKARAQKLGSEALAMMSAKYRVVRAQGVAGLLSQFGLE